MMMKTVKIIVHAASEFMKLKYDLLCYAVHSISMHARPIWMIKSVILMNNT